MTSPASAGASPSATTIPQILAHRLSTSPSEPLYTFYDDATGERVELSVQTFDNWVSKICNFFTDELMLDPGERVGIRLPTHWQSTVILVAAWSAGLVVTFDPDRPAAVGIVGPDVVTEPLARYDEVLACSLRPLGARFSEPLPEGYRDFAAEIPLQPDLVIEPVDVNAADPALEREGEVSSQERLIQLALEGDLAEHMGTHGRLLTDTNPASVDGVLPALLTPFVRGGSVVLVANPHTDSLDSKAQQEHVTCRHLRHPQHD